MSVIVQLDPASGGTKVPPGLMGVPTAHVPPSAQVPVPVSGVSVMADGVTGPASAFEPAGQGVVKQGF